MLLAVLVAAACLPSRADEEPGAGRVRISLDNDWRFKRGDPDGAATVLYEPVPEESALPGDLCILKPWILPTGNAYVGDPGKRHARPAGRSCADDLPYLDDDYDDSDWQRVRLPHDWAIAGPFIETGPDGGMGRLPSRGIGWYRKDLKIPASDAGKSVYLDIDGAMSYATVWLNGQLVGGWPYGYNSWRLDLSSAVVPGGANQLAIRLDNPPESSRWYPGGGLYRDVWLTTTNRVHVGHWGTFVTTSDVSASSATVSVAVSIDNNGASDANVSVATRIHRLDEEGRISRAPLATLDEARVTIAAGTAATTNGSTQVRKPALWGPPPTQQPHRHVAITELWQGGELVDRYETAFGIRTLEFDADAGVRVNGELIALKGVNNHHDLGALGAAFNTRAAERQLELLRDMGANAVRMSHNPPAPALLDLADRMGFLVVDEIFDVWQLPKTPRDFHLVFDDWHEQDLRAFLRRDRNHPSIILWSVGNEVGEQHTGEAGADVARPLVAIAHEEDPTRLVTTSLNWADADMPLPATMDVINLNYQGVGVRTLPSDFAAYRRQFPDKVIFSSESASTLSSRGEFLFPVSGSLSGPVRPGSGGDPRTAQVSAYEVYASDFGSSPDKSFSLHDQHPWVAGEFVWSGFDYLGEPTPYYSARSSYSGIIDLAGLKKDRFYLYQARWRPELPMVHIIPHWTWPGREGEVTPVHVFTSGDAAELFVNGESQGMKEKAPFQYRLTWDYVTYEPGDVKVVAYRDGREWATSTVRTAGPAAALQLTVDRSRIVANGRDLAYVTARVVDADGGIAPTANNAIAFSLDGPGELVATDNGDPTSFVPFPAHERDAFNGLAIAIVRGLPDRPGSINVRAASESLQSASIRIDSRRQESAP